MAAGDHFVGWERPPQASGAWCWADDIPSEWMREKTWRYAGGSEKDAGSVILGFTECENAVMPSDIGDFCYPDPEE